MSATAIKTLWKVLNEDGRSRNGGAMQWSLPKDGQPGDWHEVSGPLELCQNGFHLTENPVDWWSDNVRCFVAEFEGESVGTFEDDGKIAVRRCRLIREATEEEMRRFDLAFQYIFADDDDEEWDDFDDDEDDDDWDDDDWDDDDWDDDE